MSKCQLFCFFPFKFFVALPYYQGKDIAFRFILEYSSLKDFGPR
jgi:hypothetical protein